jgi:hypothetical protein
VPFPLEASGHVGAIIRDAVAMNSRQCREEDATDLAVKVGRSVAVHVAAWGAKDRPPEDEALRELIDGGL